MTYILFQSLTTLSIFIFYRQQHRTSSKHSMFDSLAFATLVLETSRTTGTAFLMSRAAMWRQEGGSRGREILADEIFIAACEEGRQKSSALPLWGEDTSFHFNPLLLQNCILSPYFQKCCENLKDWNAVIDEIYYEVKSVQVFQVDCTLKHVDSPYIRAIGFLYLRYVGQPDQIYNWIEPYLQDYEEFSLERAQQKDAKMITMGSYVRFLFQSRDYYGQTTLPRFPITIERELQIKLLAADKIYERSIQHYKNTHRMKQFQTIGCKVLALYGDDENPISWYPAEVDRVITHDDNGPLNYPKFVVTFTEYGNTETVTLGELDTIDALSTANGRDWNHVNRRQENQNIDLYEEVRRREREQVVSCGRDSWSRRPPTTKESLSLPHKHSSHTSAEYSRREDRPHDTRRSTPKPPNTDDVAVKPEGSNKRSAEDIATVAEKKRNLMARYG